MDMPHAESLHSWVHAELIQCSSYTHLKRFSDKMQAKLFPNAPPTLLEQRNDASQTLLSQRAAPSQTLL